MEKQWFFEFVMKIQGENSLTEEVNKTEKIKIPIFAPDEEMARLNANTTAALFILQSKRGDRRFLKGYYPSLEEDDEISFSDFRLISEENLDISIPPIIGG